LQVETTGIIHHNPTPEELRKFTEEMPQCRITEYDNVNVQTRVVSRSSRSTFVVTEDPSTTSQKAMPRQEYDRIVAMQDQWPIDTVAARGRCLVTHQAREARQQRAWKEGPPLDAGVRVECVQQSVMRREKDRAAVVIRIARGHRRPQSWITERRFVQQPVDHVFRRFGVARTQTKDRGGQ